MEELNITIINENITNFVSGINLNNPDISIKDLKEQLTKIIGQVPAITVKRAPVPINELILKSGAKVIQPKTKIEEIVIYYVDMDNKKPIKIRMVI